MEIKKSPKADLENKRGLFLEIGLIVALVLVIGAFAVTRRNIVSRKWILAMPLSKWRSPR